MYVPFRTIQLLGEYLDNGELERALELAVTTGLTATARALRLEIEAKTFIANQMSLFAKDFDALERDEGGLVVVPDDPY